MRQNKAGAESRRLYTRRTKFGLSSSTRRYSIKYRLRKAPMEETLASLHTESPSDEQIADLAEGMQTLIAVLLLAAGVADDRAGKAEMDTRR